MFSCTLKTRGVMGSFKIHHCQISLQRLTSCVIFQKGVQRFHCSIHHVVVDGRGFCLFALGYASTSDAAVRFGKHRYFASASWYLFI